MIIRMAHESDATAMGQMMVTTFLAAHRQHMPREAWDQRVREWTPEVSARGWAEVLHDIASGEAPQSCIYLAETSDGAIIGLAMGSPAVDTTLALAGAVDALYVDQRYQGKGIGRQLLQAVAAHLAQAGLVRLQIECVAANAPARAFYERMGGVAVAEKLFDEEGFLLPAVIYAWEDIMVLAAS